MALTPGSRLGSYEVLAPLGAGGMGEVYRARDTKLDREVAIKVLPAAVAQDPERLVRFERESKVVASLNHPNIAQVYGVEENGGARALVMELVAGSTLSVPQPIDTALDYARQIAEALEAAHERGITHRDLKPANIMVTPQGVVKILDFGLATAPPREGAPAPGNSPTFTMAATQAGMIMGTAGYMSPEQAAGKAVNRRSDIWSFGVVLWEMLTGARLFEGETVSHTLADVLRAPIEFGKLPQSTPEPIAELVRRCLDRNIGTRLQAIGEARIAIQKYQKDPTAGVKALPPSQAPPAKRSWTPWIAAAAFAIAAAGLGFVAYRHLQEPRSKALRTHLLPPDKSNFLPSSAPAISPDGSKLAFVGLQDGRPHLWIRDLDSLGARIVTGSVGASSPFWSPDSLSIGFQAEGKLKRIDLSGGAVLTLCAAEGNVHGASWSSRGVIVFPSSATGPLQRVSAAGGAPTPATALDQSGGEVSHRLPWFLPDDRHFLYTVRNVDQGKSAVYVGDLESSARSVVLQAEAHAAYTPHGGFLVYTTGGNVDGPLMAQAFDLSTFRVTGEPLRIVESVNLSTSTWAKHQFSVATEGTLVYMASGAASSSHLTWYDRSGKVLGTVGEPSGGVRTAAISPDGSTVATEGFQSGNRDVWLHDLERGTSSRFTFNSTGSNAMAPAWSPDGKVLLYFQLENFSPAGVMKKPLAGNGAAELLTAEWGVPPRALSFLRWSNDGRFLVARTNPGGPTGSDIWMLPLNPPGEKPRPYLESKANEGAPALSPSSDWLSYASDETQRFEVYVQSFPVPGRKYQVSVNGGSASQWSHDGKDLFFIGPGRKMMVVTVGRNGERLEIGTPKVLFDSKITVDNFTSFDVTKDGRFLIPSQEGSANIPLTLVVNWQAALKR
jgi:serine/threonine protein kinase